MDDTATVERIPLQSDDQGVIRVGGTRVTLDTIVTAFNQGATAEEIATQYPSVPLADIYQVIGYYLRHGAELEPYFSRRKRESEEIRQENERRWNPQGFRQRLLARRQSRT